ncbi:M28 family peptidase [Leptobacterium sp. I13]|uniref:M28 family peptidase n=1 Tax=Leptobacterium meishanense TaxID=3128904 RepID=UPI0030EF1D76
MKQYNTLISLFLLGTLIYWSFYALMPQNYTKENVALSEFSTECALTHVKAISQKPHYVGSPAHKEVRDYIVSELEKLGLEVELQEGYTAGDWGNLSKPVNIITRIKGTENSKALLLLSHYDSNPHSSLGASDAGSGVATILEGVRAFLASKNKPKNDIIILITDAEELGLNGAELFVNEHPWAKEVGLVLNFESRGSGGPSYMLIETNGGNAQLVKEFAEANPKYPVANSLAYSIYKMLPNDTDLTVFREDGDIDGFNFAFIDDHFDYHTYRDNYERLDRNTLEHQGNYLMPLLSYFSDSDISDVKAKKEYIYFNVPVFKLVYYPFSWIMPMLIITIVLFFVIIGMGVKRKTLQVKAFLKGFTPFVISLVICGVIGYYSWGLLKKMYPQYNDILHGFTYNGHFYIAAFVALSISICLWGYSKFKNISTANLVVAPLFFWLLICALVAVYLKGASFFIIPGIATLIALYILVNQEKPNILLIVLLMIPTVWILSPFVQMFPVGLGLKMLMAATIFTVLIFGLLLPVFGFYKQKKTLAWVGFVVFIFFFAGAHLKSGFNEDAPKPNSLVYVLDTDNNTAHWATYDFYLDNWVSQYIGNNKQDVKNDTAFSSKYNTSFSYIADAPLKPIQSPKTEITKDTIIENNRYVEICITPNRDVNRLEIFAEETLQIESCSVNGVQLQKTYLETPRRNGRLITHFISGNAYTELRMKIPVEGMGKLTLYESSNDLLTNELFSVPERPESQIPMPFVLNDAITVKKTLIIN